MHYISIQPSLNLQLVLKTRFLAHIQNRKQKVCFIHILFFFAIFHFKKMVFFIPGTDAKIFQGAQRVFTFHIEIFSLLSEPTANSVMKRSKCEKWKLFKPLEKFKRKGLGWVICFLRLIEIYLYAIIISTYQEKLTEYENFCFNWTQDPRSRKTEWLLNLPLLLISLF